MFFCPAVLWFAWALATMTLFTGSAALKTFVLYLTFVYLSAVWADADTWFERQQMEEEMQRLQAENKASIEAAEELHRKKLAEEREGEKEDDPMARAEAEVLQQNQNS